MSVKINGAEESEAMHEHSHDHHDHDHGHHHHTGLHGMEHMVRDHLCLPEAVKTDVLAVYGLIAQAESHVHGVPVEDIHFHEVGTMDALADVAAVCLLHDYFGWGRAYQLYVRPRRSGLGSGQVRCAHGGSLPVHFLFLSTRRNR